MIFTRHAIERYRQFHMLDQPTATEEDARQILESFGPAAIHTGIKTHRGDPIWRIEALGVELVAKREDGIVTCVTVLPPPRFRGLTPLQAEAVEASARQATERAAKAERHHAEVQAAIVHAKAAARNPDVAQAHREHAERLREAKNAATLATVERDILNSTLKTMRVQMTAERDADRCKTALRIAVRALLDAGATNALAAIAAIEPGLASEAFANGRRES